jgi:hypothetical protein
MSLGLVLRVRDARIAELHIGRFDRSHLGRRQVVAALLHLSDDHQAASDNAPPPISDMLALENEASFGPESTLRERPLLAQSGHWPKP